MASNYDHLTREELISLLLKRDATRKFGLVWERDEIEHERSLNDDFVVLDLDEDLSVGKPPFRNIIIEADNFDALRYLHIAYKARAKCIYIDPPYNTGNKDFIYNDRFLDSEDAYRHSKWLEYLYQRLLLAKDLLADDGVLYVSINDDNRSKLELLLDQVFPKMRIGSMVWRTRDSTSVKGRNFSDVHEHILIYGGPRFTFQGAEKSMRKYKNPDNDRRGPWNIDPLTLAFDRFERPNLFYPICNPKTGRWYPCDPNRVWAYASENNVTERKKLSSETMEEWIRQEKIIFPSEEDERVVVWNTIEDLRKAIDIGDIPVTPKKRVLLLSHDTPNLEFWVGKPVGFGRPGFKKHWKDLRSHTNPVSSWIARINEQIDDEETLTLRSREAGEGTGALQAIFGRRVFNHPKPPSLIKQLIAQATDRSGLVVDFFAGSGTTAQAVLELNAEDGGDREIVLISSTEANEKEPNKNVCKDVCAPRVKAIINGFAGRRGTGGEFAYMRAKRVPRETLAINIKHDQIWFALQHIHTNAITPFREDKAFQMLDGEMATINILYLPLLNETVLTLLRKQLDQSLTPTIVYSWQPGVIQQRFNDEHIQIRTIPQYLIERFGGGEPWSR